MDEQQDVSNDTNYDKKVEKKNYGSRWKIFAQAGKTNVIRFRRITICLLFTIGNKVVPKCNARLSIELENVPLDTVL